MSNFYCSREAVQRGALLYGTEYHTVIDRLIEASSRGIDGTAHTRFIPLTDVRYFPFSSKYIRGAKLYFDADLWSLTSLTDQGTTARTLTSGTHFILQPDNEGPPYHWAEILSSQALTFESGSTTSQRAFTVTGQWSRHSATLPASQLNGAISSTTATSLEVDDGSKVEVGFTLLIESEQCFVSERDEVDIGTNSTNAMTADDTDTALTLGDPTNNLCTGELIRINSEQMRVTAVSSATEVVVERAVNGSTLAAHLTAQDIYVYRRFTVERGVNGTTAATHADNTTLTRYAVPGPIEELCVAETIAALQQERAGWGRVVGTGERQVELSGRALSDLRRRALGQYRRHQLVSF